MAAFHGGPGLLYYGDIALKEPMLSVSLAFFWVKVYTVKRPFSAF